MIILAVVFKFQSQDSKSIPMLKERQNYSTDMGSIYLTACLRRAGEIHDAKSSSGEVNDNGEFGQIIRNRTVHLLAIFLMIYIGVEVTIGGIYTFSSTA